MSHVCSRSRCFGNPGLLQPVKIDLTCKLFWHPEQIHHADDTAFATPSTGTQLTTATMLITTLIDALIVLLFMLQVISTALQTSP
jgi:hypothetical protein